MVPLLLCKRLGLCYFPALEQSCPTAGHICAVHLQHPGVGLLDLAQVGDPWLSKVINHGN